MSERFTRLPNYQIVTNPLTKLDDISKTYSLFFGDYPWFEKYIDSDGKFYGPEYDSNWKQLDLKPAYPQESTMQYIQTELSKPNSKSVILTNPNSSQIVGFGWGYEFPNPTELVNSKWPSTSDLNKQLLSDVITSQTGPKKIWYLSEVGILPEQQNQSLGTSIVTKLISKTSLPIIMRTNQNSSMKFIAQKTGFSIVTNFSDPIDPTRVLFSRKENI